jgi:CRISPR/Cas system CSM-associated protein Csm2 small subunit
MSNPLLNIPSLSIPTNIEPTKGVTLNDSYVRYEITRMILAGHSNVQISRDLDQYFNVKASPGLITAFQKNYYPLYCNIVTKWEASKVTNAAVKGDLDKMTTETSTIFKEVNELHNILSIIDERIALIRDEEDRSAQYEKVLVDLLRARMSLLERQTRVVGSSGMTERLKDAVKQTALVMQETLLPFITETDRERAYDLFLREVSKVLEKLDTSG